MIIDLHNHSYYSDGVLSPTKVTDLAKEGNLKRYILINRNDTIKSLFVSKYDIIMALIISLTR